MAMDILATSPRGTGEHAMATRVIDREAIPNRAEPPRDRNATAFYPSGRIVDERARFLALLDELRRKLDEGFEYVRTVTGSLRSTPGRRKSATPAPCRSARVCRRGTPFPNRGL
jgi:hypothetical protein